MLFKKFLKKRELLEKLHIEKIIAQKQLKVWPRIYVIGKIPIGQPHSKEELVVELERIETAIRRVKSL